MQKSTKQQAETLTTPTERLRAHVQGLRGVSGTLRVDVQGKTMGALVVEDGTTEFVPGSREGQATANFQAPDDVRALLRGEVHPVVAALQRRVEIEGDAALGARIILGMRSGVTFNAVDESRKE
jgi:hypothetical protein